MSFWCQSCGEQHTPPHVTQANITSCAKCGGSHFATWKPVRPSLSQEAVRDEALEEAAKVVEENGILYGSHDPFAAGWNEANEAGANMIRAIKRKQNTQFDHNPLVDALKREPNAAARAHPSGIASSDSPLTRGDLQDATDRLSKPAPAAPEVQQPLQPVDPSRVHAGWSIKGEPVYLDESLAPDVAEMVKRLRACCIDYDGSEEVDGAPPVIVPSCAELRQAASLLERLSK